MNPADEPFGPLELKSAEVHNPLFLAGRNLGTKLDPGKLAGLRLFYDRKEKELLVHWASEIGVLPSSNVACMVFGVPVKRAEQYAHPIVAGIAASAQVETPMSHVHAGFGHGKTGKSK